MPDRTYTPGFQSLELKATPWTRWAGSLAVNGAFIIALLLIPAAVTYTVQPVQKVTNISLIAPPPLTPYKPAYKPKPLPQIVQKVVIPKPVRRFEAPVPKVAPVQAVKLIAPVAVETPKVETAKLETPKIEIPRPTVFPTNNEPAPAPAAAPVHVVKTGGFGDPNGVPANSTSTKPSTLVQAGAFDLSPGTGQGSGKGVAGRVLVASAGFGDGYGSSGTGTGGNGNGHGAVRAGGFGDLDSAARPERSASPSKPAVPAETPVEITFKPKPAYTPEAREKKIEGDVQLQVVFSSAGQIQVLRLVRGLGYGLDENARQAAAQIRFRPGTRNGVPVDVTGTVHIVFQIS